MFNKNHFLLFGILFLGSFESLFSLHEKLAVYLRNPTAENLESLEQWCASKSFGRCRVPTSYAPNDNIYFLSEISRVVNSTGLPISAPEKLAALIYFFGFCPLRMYANRDFKVEDIKEAVGILTESGLTVDSVMNDLKTVLSEMLRASIKMPLLSQKNAMTKFYYDESINVLKTEVLECIHGKQYCCVS